MTHTRARATPGCCASPLTIWRSTPSTVRSLETRSAISCNASRCIGVHATTAHADDEVSWSTRNRCIGQAIRSASDCPRIFRHSKGLGANHSDREARDEAWSIGLAFGLQTRSNNVQWAPNMWIPKDNCRPRDLRSILPNRQPPTLSCACAPDKGELMSARSDPIRILSVDDHPLVRAGIEALVSTQPDMRLVAECSNGRDAIQQFRAHRPDVTLMDLQMPA